MRSHNDADLVRRAQQGDERAFTALIKPLRTKLVRHVFAIVGNIDDAEDVVQVTLMRASRSLGQFRAESAFSTWLTKIARNTALNSIRKRTHDPLYLREETSRDQDQSGLDNALRFAPEIETPDAVLQAQERRESLACAYASLPPELSGTFRLYNDGLSYEEIAKQLAVPVGTVRSRIHRARDALGLLKVQ